MTASSAIAAIEAAWAGVAERYPAYELLVPGSPSFVCLAAECPVHCCKVFSVSLNEREVARMERASGLRPVQFLESEDGAPIALPLAQPYLLARRDGQCALLGADLLCGQYQGRPDSCRLYPHFVLFLDPASGRPVHADMPGMQGSLQTSLADSLAPAPYVPALIRHRTCPGFGGPPLDVQTWRELLAETCRLQYSEAGGVEWPPTASADLLR